ncbi:hypothetical protein AVEN_166268-1 [Araneus ventricosus]|uniref:Uncharacterized protein n=1 Tax=Araneus ventricosus TaxID=182803 RepID=A0A4Y2IU15_ARAVE|nr:hypothetical protein AVEN_166268-1 [Araneus ventricosus]
MHDANSSLTRKPWVSRWRGLCGMHGANSDTHSRKKNPKQTFFLKKDLNADSVNAPAKGVGLDPVVSLICNKSFLISTSLLTLTPYPANQSKCQTKEGEEIEKYVSAF